MDSELNPYAPPRADSTAEPIAGAGLGDAVFRDPSPQAATIVGLTVLSIGGTLLSAAFVLWSIRMVYRYLAGETLTAEEVALNERLGNLLFFARGLIDFAAGIVFLVWTYRTASNLPALGVTERQFTPEWAIVSYFIPIVSLFMPAQALAEIWRASDPARRTGGRAASQIPLVVWWVLYLSASFAALALHFAGYIPDVSTETQLLQWQASLFAILGLTLPMQGLTIWLVRTLTRNQLARRAIIAPPDLRAPS